MDLLAGLSQTLKVVRWPLSSLVGEFLKDAPNKGDVGVVLEVGDGHCKNVAGVIIVGHNILHTFEGEDRQGTSGRIT